MRIVVSGYSGTGKTSLCTGLAARHGLAAIAEGFAPLVDAEAEFMHVVRGVLAGNMVDDGVTRRMAQAYRDWAEHRRAAYAGAGGAFVADRWEADLLAAWLLRFAGMDVPVDHHTDWLLRDMKDKAARIDLVILTPLQPVFAGRDTRNDDGLRRNSSLTRQVAWQGCIDWLTRRLAHARLVELPIGLTLEQRLDFVDRVLDRSRRTSA